MNDNKEIINGKQTRHALPWPWIIAGATLGGLVVYLCDPFQGKRRRVFLRDKGVRLVNLTTYFGGKYFRDLINRGQGVIAKITKLEHREIVDNTTLVERIRSQIGRRTRHPGSIVVKADNGKIILSGPILESEVKELLQCVKNIPGVEGIINYLDIHKHAENIPELQGEGKTYLQ